jgi:hypothetical protein
MMEYFHPSLDRITFDPQLGHRIKPPDPGLELVHAVLGMNHLGLEKALVSLEVADPEDYDRPFVAVKAPQCEGLNPREPTQIWTPDLAGDQFEAFYECFIADLDEGQEPEQARSLPDLLPNKSKESSSPEVLKTDHLFGTKNSTSYRASASDTEADDRLQAGSADPNLRSQIVSGLPSTWPMWTRTLSPVMARVPDPFTLRARELAVFRRNTAPAGPDWPQLDFTPLSQGMKLASSNSSKQRSSRDARKTGKRRRRILR